MPTEINGYSPGQETPLSSLVINEVDSTETFEKMKEKGLLQDNQLYLVTDEQPSAGIDEVPTEGSKNLVYSGGVYNALKQVGSADSVTEQNNSNEEMFWVGTQEEYDAITTKDPNTLYILTDEGGSATSFVTHGELVNILEALLNKKADLGADGKVVSEQLSTHASQHASDGTDPITPTSIGAAETSHTHDDRYYTEAEVNDLLAAKASSYSYGAEDLTAGTSTLETGKLYFVYE